MEKVFCANASNIDKDECACIKDLTTVTEKSLQLKVSLPVICFGENCAQKNSYKTKGMVQQPCNFTICQQIFNQAPDIFVGSENKIFCSGRFFNDVNLANSTNANNAGTVSDLDISDTPNRVTKNEFPFYVWIMLGIGSLLFIVLIYLMFGPKPKNNSTSLNNKIDPLTKKNNSFSASNDISNDPSFDISNDTYNFDNSSSILI
jgi:hypothetical protein